MATGLCTAAVTLTAEEITRLGELPRAQFVVEEADGCWFRGGHDGRHIFPIQAQDFEDGTSVSWWVVWEGPAEPDAQGSRSWPSRRARRRQARS